MFGGGWMVDWRPRDLCCAWLFIFGFVIREQVPYIETHGVWFFHSPLFPFSLDAQTKKLLWQRIWIDKKLLFIGFRWTITHRATHHVTTARTRVAITSLRSGGLLFITPNVMGKHRGTLSVTGRIPAIFASGCSRRDREWIVTKLVCTGIDVLKCCERIIYVCAVQFER